MVKVSVIVPIYNVEEFLEECLKSLVNQTIAKEQFQVILVDDGSTDASGKIADEFAKENSNFEVYHKQNEGVSKAREFGVGKAIGQFIGFVDSDDYCHVEMFQRLSDLMVEYNLDIVACRHFTFLEGDCVKTETKASYDNKVLATYRDIFENVIYNTIIDGQEPVVLWNKLYHRKLFQENEIDFGKDVLEDYLVNMQCLMRTQRFLQITDCLYYYRISKNSLSRTFNQNLFKRLLEVQQIKENIFKEEFSQNSELNIKANKWFVKYLESILKSLYLYNARNGLDRDVYARNVIQHKIVKDKAQYLVLHGIKNNFIKCIHQDKVKNIIVQIKLKVLIYKIIKRIKK